MRNKAYYVDYFLKGDDPKVWTLPQYIVVYDQNSTLGKRIDKELYNPQIGDVDYEKLNKTLEDAFGINYDDVAFFYGTTHDMTDEDIINSVYVEGDIIIDKDQLGKPIYEKKGEK